MIKNSFKNLQVWQRSLDLSFSIYNLSKQFPQEELYGITSQLRRAAISVPSNIAEGSQRTSDKDFARFVLISKGSLAEIETQLIMANKLSYINVEFLNKLLIEIEILQKMLHSFYLKLIAKS